MPTQSLDGHWQNLAGDDAAKAYRSIWALVSTPRESAAFLKEKLQPVALTDAKQLAQSIAGLDSTRFADRKKATDALEKLGELAEPELRKALAKNPSLEVRQRIEKLLHKLEGPVSSPELLRALRAIEVLEHIGTSAAQLVLDNMAKGAPEARATQDAKQSLERLRKRNSAKA